MNIIDGKAIAEGILEGIHFHGDSQPVLAIIQANNDESSRRYIAHKSIQAEELGIRVQGAEFSPEVTADEVMDLIEKLNDDPAIHGILLQLPLYDELKPQQLEIINCISPDKDVDGLTAINQGFATQGEDSVFLPATVAAVLESLKAVNTDLISLLQGKHVLIINHSNLVGKPLAGVMLNYNATVTVAHIHTNNISELVGQADIVISASGTPGLLKADMFKDGAIAIDVTSIKTEGGVKGDIEVSPELEQKLSWLSPVPGGIGPLTIACLLRNFQEAYELQTEQN